MSHKSSEFSSRLGRERSPESPRHLDQVILAYAKQHAPAKPRFQHWVPVLASLSVAGIAVLLMLQYPQIGDVEPLLAPRLNKPAAVERKVVEMDKQESIVTGEQGAVQQSAQDFAGVAGDMAESEAGASEVNIQNGQSKKLRASTAKAAPFANVSQSMVEMPVAHEQDAAPVPPVLATGKKTAPATIAREQTSSRTLEETAMVNAELLYLRDLLQSGEPGLARERYAALKQQCPRCNLPDRLEQALQELAEGR